VLANEAVTSPIIGASRPGQLDASLAAAGYALDPELKRQLDDLTQDYRMGDAPRLSARRPRNPAAFPRKRSRSCVDVSAVRVSRGVLAGAHDRSAPQVNR
jgi:hypothetical protein